jgi:peptide/nickel transport system permease protein
MYGGRISLLIGFVVVIIELILGVIIGGIAGYFGGWVDNLLMRFVDIIYCIPAMPLYLILGSIMDFYKASATVRIYMLCFVMGIIGWVGIARIVRGQILSLREQEFMTATEATGIRTSRRIFRHLIPNVIPQMVVFASMEVGGVILSESTLSFLGLGIKYPAASWGSIINAVTDSYVMTNYLFVWIPAGILILLTVLAFNFIGDGLRDAFDPKMKR